MPNISWYQHEHLKAVIRKALVDDVFATPIPITHLSRQLHLGASTLGHILNGQIPSRLLAERIAAGLDMPLWDLLGPYQAPASVSATPLSLAPEGDALRVQQQAGPDMLDEALPVMSTVSPEEPVPFAVSVPETDAVTVLHLILDRLGALERKMDAVSARMLPLHNPPLDMHGTTLKLLGGTTI